MSNRKIAFFNDEMYINNENNMIQNWGYDRLY